MKDTFTLDYLANYVNGILFGDPNYSITSPGSIDSAGPEQIAFAEKGPALKSLAATKAGAVIVPSRVEEPGVNLIQVENPRLSFAKVLHLFRPSHGIAAGVHPSAVIGDRCRLGNGVAIGAGVVVGHDVFIGDRVVLYPNVVVGDHVKIGDDTIIYPNTSVLERCRVGQRVIIHAGTVIGSDGFGFVFDDGRYHKVPQLGIVQIDDDVEIGANNTIDRAALGRTWIKAGVKLDNLIHIAHNVEIGEHGAITGQVGIAGSTIIGRYLRVGGQAGIGGHLTLGDGVTVGPQCAVVQSVPDKQTVSGTTVAMPHGTWLRLQKILCDVPALFKKVQRLEKRTSAPDQDKNTQ